MTEQQVVLSIADWPDNVNKNIGAKRLIVYQTLQKLLDSKQDYSLPDEAMKSIEAAADNVYRAIRDAAEECYRQSISEAESTLHSLQNTLEQLTGGDNR